MKIQKAKELGILGMDPDEHVIEIESEDDLNWVLENLGVAAELLKNSKTKDKSN